MALCMGGSMFCHKSPLYTISLYDDISFVCTDGELDQTPNTVRFVDYFFAAWNVCPSDECDTLRFGNSVVMLPVAAFSSGEGHAIHHFVATWLDTWLKKV